MDTQIKVKAVVYEVEGPASVLEIKEIDFPSNEGREDFVWIKTEANGINRAECLQRNGEYPHVPGESAILGLEASGYLVNSPDEYTSGAYKNNDKIMALICGGSYADVARIHKDHYMKIPDNLSFEEAAAIPETWLTSYQLLFLVANTTKGKTVLVHAAASGIGCASIQLCKMVGATVIAVASSDDKLEFAKSLGATYTINYKENPDFSELVHEYTDGKGVDVILDCIGAQNFTYNIKAAASDCQWVFYGLLGGVLVQEIDISTFLWKRLQFLPTTLKIRSYEYKANLIKRFSAECLPLFASGELKPVIDKVMKYSEMVQAHEYMESNKTKGKIVCINDMN